MPDPLPCSIPIVAIICGAMVKIAHVRSRDRGDAIPSDVANRLSALETEVGELRRELGEAHERLDFTERLLAQTKDARLGDKA